VRIAIDGAKSTGKTTLFPPRSLPETDGCGKARRPRTANVALPIEALPKRQALRQKTKRYQSVIEDGCQPPELPTPVDTMIPLDERFSLAALQVKR
jgi:hypothetical protein